MRKILEQLEAALRSAGTDLEKAAALNAHAAYFQYRHSAKSQEFAEQSRSLAATHADSGSPEWKAELADSLKMLCFNCLNMSRADLFFEYADLALAYYGELESSLGNRARAGKGYVLIYKALALLAKGERDHALEHFEESLAIGRALGEKSLEARALNSLGNLYQREGNFQKALELQQEALDIFRAAGDRLGEANALNNVALCHEEFGNLSVALEYHERSMNIQHELDNPNGKACSLHNIGIIHRSLGRFEKALECFEESLRIRKVAGNQLDESYALANLADLCALQKDYPKALQYAREQLSVEERIGNEAETSWGHLNVGYVLCLSGDCAEGLDHLLRSFCLSRKLGLNLLLCSCLTQIGQIYARDPETARRLPTVRLAQQLGIEETPGTAFWARCLEKALTIAQESSFKMLQHEIHLHLSELHKSLGNFENALEHLERHDILREEIYSEEVKRKIGNLQIAFEAEGSRKEAEILRAKSEELATINKQLTREIAARKKTEEQWRRLEQLAGQARKMKSLNVMAASVAHNFNNLLTGVLGNLEMALEKLRKGSAARQMVEQAEKAANRAAELSRVMLLYVGQGREMPKAIDLSSLVKETVENHEFASSDKALVRCCLPGGLMAVLGGTEQIRGIVLSLLTNAYEAMGKSGGTITLTTSAVQCDRDLLLHTYLYEDQPEGPYIRLEVSDTGCGMDKATMNRLFDPFFSKKAAGRGLGLAVTLGIVRGHRGVISVSSEAGKGTTFQVYLPALRFAAPPATADQGAGPGDWKGHGAILLVDDEEMVRSVGARMLQRAGFKVLVASSGEEAIEIFRAHQDEVSCVLLDLSMAGLDGAEAFAELRKIRQDVPVLVSSGYCAADVMAHFGQDRPAGFLQKPYQSQALIAELRSLLETPRAS